MPPILKLSPEISAQLRSQVLIKSIQDVVRELLCNAVDAGASVFTIKIDLESLSVCVEDNGSGILSSNLNHVGKRNFTTKNFNRFKFTNTEKHGCDISPQGFFNLEQPLGFRGEALSCIADQSSKLMLLSAVENSVKFKFLKGECSSDLVNVLLSFFRTIRPTQGTVVVVNRLFHNIPVRKKYARKYSKKELVMKEVKNIIFQVLAYRPFVSINASFIENGELQTFSSTKFELDPRLFFSSLYKIPETSLQNVLYAQDSTWSLEGFYGFCEEVKLAANFVFCNGYSVQLSSQRVGSIRSVIERARTKSECVTHKSIKKYTMFCLNIKPKSLNDVLFETGEFSQISWFRLLGLLKDALECFADTPKDGVRYDSQEKRESILKTINTDDVSQVNRYHPTLKTLSISSSDLHKGNFKIISQVDQSFILATVKDRLFVIDQHACDERITVEALFKSYAEQAYDPDCDLRVKCKIPVSMDLNREEAKSLQDIHCIMTQFGIDFQLKENSLTVTHLPCYLHKYTDPVWMKSCLIQYCAHLENQANFKFLKNSSNWFFVQRSFPRAVSDAIASLACRSSIKFGKVLTKGEMRYLLIALGKCNLPFQCAHGRPTVIPVGNMLHLGNFCDDYDL
ncbi:hypothetical protein JCM33374_g5414 [Metschnikowia sp. JCM 33374]|nr:hypothetical protein JCM33374_g5414 [Metschnikowia sp. JCM 33374]